ncbi:MAG: TonB-dependent receptor [Candidatus Cloacimonetes bacterium]|nr:TonB-dependent receptor [Candidatus Cloacimonadota bacterium]
MKKIVILLLFAIFYLLSKAAIVSGYVQSENGHPLGGVLVKSSLAGTISAEDGRFLLKAMTSDTLLFHKLGYSDLQIAMALLPKYVRMQKEAIPVSGSSISARYTATGENLPAHWVMVAEESSSSDLSELISRNSALYSTGTQTAGLVQTLAVPGFDARHTLIMLDGISLNAAGEEFDLSQIPLAMVAEIEIIPGNLNALAGSGSMGAIINIKTRNLPSNFHYEISQETGSFAYYKTDLLLGVRKKTLSLQASATSQQAENDFEYEVPAYWNMPSSTLKRENNRFRQLDLAAVLKFNYRQHLLEYKVFYTDYFRMLPGPVNNPEQFHLARITGNILRQQLRLLWQSNILDLELQAWHDQDDNIYDNTRLEEPYNNYPLYYIYGKNRQSITGCRPRIKWRSAGWLRLDLGAEYLNETYAYQEITQPQNSIPEKKRDTVSGFTATELTRNVRESQLWLKGNFRQDSSSDFAEHPSFSLLTGWRPQNGLGPELTLTYSDAYTLPSFYNLYWQGSSEAVGNPDLLPEKNKSYQVHGKFTTAGFDLGINWRHDDLQDKIAWIQTFNKAWKPVNIAAAKVVNLEVNANIMLPWSLSAKGLWNFTFSEDKTLLENGEHSAYYGKKLIYTPDYRGNLTLTWQPGKLLISAGSEFVGKQWTTRDQLIDTKELPAYSIYNLFISYIMPWKKVKMTLALKINNIRNEFYQTYDYMPQPGRSFLLSLKISPQKNNL